MTEENKIAHKPSTIKELLSGDKFKGQIALALPRHLKPDRFIRIALTALTRTPKLMECSPESLFKCLLDLSALGIEPDGRRAHLIPYGNTATLILDYKGIAELVLRSGEVSKLHADIVCENDVFEYDRGEIKAHKIDFRKPRGAMFASYALALMKDGTEACQVLAKEEVDAVRKRSRACGSGPWVTDYNEMAKKTAFRRLSKWLPLSPELREKVDTDEDASVADVVTVGAPKRAQIVAPENATAYADDLPMGDGAGEPPPFSDATLLGDDEAKQRADFIKRLDAAENSTPKKFERACVAAGFPIEGWRELTTEQMRMIVAAL